MKLIVTSPRVGTSRASYRSDDGRYVITPRYDGSYGRGAMVPRGWTVEDLSTGTIRAWVYSLNDWKKSVSK